MPRPDLVIEKNETTSRTVTTKSENEPKNDLYNELLKLDDLKKRGIITEEEFQGQKKKLLESKTIR
ncbi:MAG: SHOCT domain-containing protein [Holophagaceae bacterium]|uniref:SHOCT domain-containing protein n=1 Tax=Candidatus Geothrix odensensis TaxID=2954440 RepID=A0A936K829_9BACT|nr:SHOCT domain-containing protein [Candidatus Geothrix odensensis]